MTCGSHLFWRQPTEDYTGILAASIDEPTGQQMAKRIFVELEGDYCEITDGLPQFAGYHRQLILELFNRQLA